MPLIKQPISDPSEESKDPNSPPSTGLGSLEEAMARFQYAVEAAQKRDKESGDVFDPGLDLIELIQEWSAVKNFDSDEFADAGGSIGWMFRVFNTLLSIEGPAMEVALDAVRVALLSAMKSTEEEDDRTYGISVRNLTIGVLRVMDRWPIKDNSSGPTNSSDPTVES